MAPVGTPVRAIADGVVVRTVEGFAWRDFDRLQRGSKLNGDQLRLNLDVYRGNQVWLKTADGNVTFYSHLRDVAPGISEGVFVQAGEMLGTIGISGVPDRSYDNPHLHFEIQKNPHDGGDAKSPLSIMRWDWLGKGLSKAEANELVGKTFARP
jgi:murein DD-endopeptidase MepM/ murein hydrolase activator NlpD